MEASSKFGDDIECPLEPNLGDEHCSHLGSLDLKRFNEVVSDSDHSQGLACHLGSLHPQEVQPERAFDVAELHINAPTLRV